MTTAVRPASSAVERVLDQRLGDRVDVGGGLVQDQDARVGQHGAGDADQLALAHRQVDPAFQDRGAA